jgi:hypothetical protein
VTEYGAISKKEGKKIQRMKTGNMKVRKVYD